MFWARTVNFKPLVNAPEIKKYIFRASFTINNMNFIVGVEETTTNCPS